MMQVKLRSKFLQNLVQNVVRLLKEMVNINRVFYICFIFFFIILKEVVCTWYVHDVHILGVGCVKQNGQESV